MAKQCFLFRTHNIESYERYQKIKSCNYPNMDFFYIIDTSVYSGELPDGDDVIGINGDEIWDMWNGLIWNKKYQSNTQFYILNFFKEHPGYDYYWLCEDDIYMPNGDYYLFFKESEKIDCDFLHTSKISNQQMIDYKSFLFKLIGNESLFDKYKFCTWVQFFRLSPNACEVLIKEFVKEHRVHAELYFPSIISNNELSTHCMNESDDIRYRFIIHSTKLHPNILNGEMRNVFYHPMKVK